MGALAIASVGLQMFGTISSSISTAEEGRQKRQIAEFNAKIDERNAEEALKESEFQAKLLENQLVSDQQFIQFQIDLVKAEGDAQVIENAFRVHTARLINKRGRATQRSGVSANGLAISGSALEVMAETASMMEMGVMEIQRETRLTLDDLERRGLLLEREKFSLTETGITQIKLVRRAGKINQRNLLESAQNTRLGGAASERAGRTESQTRLLSGAASTANNFLSLSQAGAFS